MKAPRPWRRQAQALVSAALIVGAVVVWSVPAALVVLGVLVLVDAITS